MGMCDFGHIEEELYGVAWRVWKALGRDPMTLRVGEDGGVYGTIEPSAAMVIDSSFVGTYTHGDECEAIESALQMHRESRAEHVILDLQRPAMIDHTASVRGPTRKRRKRFQVPHPSG